MVIPCISFFLINLVFLCSFFFFPLIVLESRLHLKFFLFLEEGLHHDDLPFKIVFVTSHRFCTTVFSFSIACGLFSFLL